MNHKVDQLLSSATGPDLDELRQHVDAVGRQMRAYKKAPTAPNKKNWDAGKAGLQECVDRLWPVYFPGAPDSPQAFARQKDALAWLHSQGKKVSSGKFSNDWNRGAVKLEPDGRSVTVASLTAYAASLEQDARKLADLEQMQRRKLQLELDGLERKAEREELENRRIDETWMLREAAVTQAAALIGLVVDTLSHHLRQQEETLILACGGQTSRAAEFRHAIDTVLTTACNEVASAKELELEFAHGEDDDC